MARRLAYVFLCMALAIAHTCYAQDSPQDFLGPQNAARYAVGLQPLSWDYRLAFYAQNYADQRRGDCHHFRFGGPYGENFFWGPSKSFHAGDAVRLWLSGKEYYDYSRNSCAPGRDCGEYLQIVWRRTFHLGCARVLCDGGGVFIICFYDPPGNIFGERPY